MAESDGGSVVRLNKLGVSLLSGALLLGFGGLGTLMSNALGKLSTLSDNMVEIMAWRTQHEKNEALPRTEWEIEKRYIFAEMEQLRARQSLLENRVRE